MKLVNRRSVSFAVLVAVLLSGSAFKTDSARGDEITSQDSAKTEVDRLQGDWQVIGLIDCCGLPSAYLSDSQKPLTVDRHFRIADDVRIVIKGTKWTPKRGDKHFPGATFDVNPQAELNEIDLAGFAYFHSGWRADLHELHKEGQFASVWKEKIRGIYKWKGDKLTLCLSLGGRPKSFAVNRAGRHWLMVLKRAERPKE